MPLAYFRHVYGDAFTRQEEAKKADGYVAGSFVLELKGQSNSWLTGLLQGLAYKNKGLDFSQIIVGAKNFLAVWRVADLPEDIRDEISAAKGAPNRIGSLFAKKYAKFGKVYLSGSNPKAATNTRRTISVAGRKRIAEAQRARWAKQKQAQKPKRTMSASARRKIAAAQRKRRQQLRARQKKAA